MRTDDAVEDLQDVLWNTFRFAKEFIIFDEAIVISTNETDGLQVWQYCV